MSLALSWRYNAHNSFSNFCVVHKCYDDVLRNNLHRRRRQFYFLSFVFALLCSLSVYLRPCVYLYLCMCACLCASDAMTKIRQSGPSPTVNAFDKKGQIVFRKTSVIKRLDILDNPFVVLSPSFIIIFLRSAIAQMKKYELFHVSYSNLICHYWENHNISGMVRIHFDTPLALCYACKCTNILEFTLEPGLSQAAKKYPITTEITLVR